MKKQTNMKARIVCAIVVGILCIPAVNYGQSRLRATLGYSVAGPTGDFSKVIEKPSFRGWRGAVEYSLTPAASIGLGFGFQDFYQKNDRKVYTDGEGQDISGVVTNSIQTIPVMIKGKYKFGEEGGIRPFVGAGIGGNVVFNEELIGQFRNNSENKVRFAAEPEIGVFIPFRKGGETGLELSGAYTFAPYNLSGIKNLNTWGVRAGIGFGLRR
jgi:opacity protein-like surface antigen